MNKSDLTEAVAQAAGITGKKASSAVNTVFEAMTQALEQGDRVELRGFGSFVVRDYKGYSGRNPKTGAVMEVGPKRLPFFKVGKGLKGRVDQ